MSGDAENAALDMLQPNLQRANSVFQVKVVDADPEFDPIRENPRFRQMLAEAKKRLGISAPPI